MKIIVTNQKIFLLTEFQEQLKFIYDTLEEFVVCGYTFFPVKDISQHLKQKSVRKPGSKTNQYEKEYGVIFYTLNRVPLLYTPRGQEGW